MQSTPNQEFTREPLSRLVLAPAVRTPLELDIVEPSDRSFVVSPLDHKQFNVARIGRYRRSNLSPMVDKIVVATDDNSLDGAADIVARIAMRCWEQSANVLGLDVSVNVDGQKIVIFLSNGGVAGGQELLSNAVTTTSGLPMSAVYINQVGTLTDRVERLREVAHECGHAFFPAIGGFSDPENWSNGNMGERVLPAMMLYALESGALKTDDVGGVTLQDLQAYTRSRYEKSIDQIALGGPSQTFEGSLNSNGFNYSVALLCYAQAMFSRPLFRRILSFGGDGTTAGFSRGMEEAVGELGHLNLFLPQRYRGRSIWIPARFRTAQGGKVLSYRGSWSKVAVTNLTLELFR